MTTLEMQIAAYLATVILQNGVQAGFQIYDRWKAQDPTLSDFALLKSLPINPDLQEDPLVTEEGG